jgi:hypothetical protein
MLNKTMIAFSAAIVLSTAATAFAYEDPENKIGDRYPFLEQRYTPVAANTLRSRNQMTRQVSYSNQYAYEDPENKLGDRYPFLELVTQPISTNKFAGRYPAPRLTSSAAQYAYEAPENKIGDRYPLLERQIAFQSGPARRAASSRTTGIIR